MLNFLVRIWRDISRGENLDAHITIVIALLLSVANLLGIANADLIPAITLAVLTLLAVSALVSRYRVEDLGLKISPSIDSLFVEDISSNLKEDLETANEIWLIGMSLGDLINQYYSIFEAKLRQGSLIRVLVCDPNDERVIELSEMRAYVNPNRQRAQSQIIAALSDLCKLREIAPSQLLIRTIAFPLPHRVCAINPNYSSGKLYISNYPFKTPGGSLPQFVIRAKDERWFKLYRQEAMNFWDNAKVWNCSEQK